MYSTWGNKLRYSLFGDSHGEGVGITIHGLPAGIALDLDAIHAALKMRSPGGKHRSKRAETDIPEILSGSYLAHTSGAPLSIFIRNKEHRSSDYKGFERSPRPSHADYVNVMANGYHADIRGGGHFSGRLTAPLVAAGAVLKEYLKNSDIRVAYHISNIGGVKDDCELCKLSAEDAELIKQKALPMHSEISSAEARHLLDEVEQSGNSLGASVSCAILNPPTAIGKPFFWGLESIISQLAFSIPGVKAVEFGAGRRFAEMRGSEANDAFAVDKSGSESRICTKTNNSGGINGGLSNGMPITFTCTFRPTPSIAIPQESVDIYSKENCSIQVDGRHDPCIAIRACPAVEAVALMAIFDCL